MVKKWKKVTTAVKLATRLKRSPEINDNTSVAKSKGQNKGKDGKKSKVGKVINKGKGNKVREVESDSGSSGSYYSDEDSNSDSYNSSDYSDNESNSRNRRITKNSTQKNQNARAPNAAALSPLKMTNTGGEDSDSSSDDSSYGCGVYHRRESLSQSSSDDDGSAHYSRSSEDSSYDSRLHSSRSSGSRYSSSSGSRSRKGRLDGSSSSTGFFFSESYKPIPKSREASTNSLTSNQSSKKDGKKQSQPFKALAKAVSKGGVSGVFKRRKSLDYENDGGEASATSSSKASKVSKASKFSKTSSIASSSAASSKNNGPSGRMTEFNKAKSLLLPEDSIPESEPSASTATTASSLAFTRLEDDRALMMRKPSGESRSKRAIGSSGKVGAGGGGFSREPSSKLSKKLSKGNDASSISKKKKTKESSKSKAISAANEKPAQDTGEDKFSDLLAKVRKQKSSAAMKQVEAPKKVQDTDKDFAILLNRVRSHRSEMLLDVDENACAPNSSAEGENEAKTSEANTLASALNQSRNNNANKIPLSTEKMLSSSKKSKSIKTNAPSVDDGNVDLSTSVRKELLENANSNLQPCSSDSDSENSFSLEQTSSTNKSRFASMMKNLKSNNETKGADGIASSTHSSIIPDDSDSDDEHLFEAPKIVDQMGNSMRGLLNQSQHSLRKYSSSEGDSDGEETDNAPKSRFQMQKAGDGKISSNQENIDDDSSSSGSIDIAQSSEESEKDDGDNMNQSVSTESSAEYITDEKGHASMNNMQKSFSEESLEEYYSSEDDDDDDDEPAMTILTPITEVDNETFATGPLGRHRSSIMSILSIQSEGTGREEDPEKTVAALKSKALPVPEKDKVAEDWDSSDEESDSSESLDETQHSAERISGSDSDESTSESEGVRRNGADRNDHRRRDGVNKRHGNVLMTSTNGNKELQNIILRLREDDPTLKEISFDNCGLSDSDIAPLINALHENTHVFHISLTENKLGDVSAISMAKALFGNETISILTLRGNKIGDKGALSLKRVLKINDTLHHLDLNENDIDSSLLEEMAKNSSVVASPNGPALNGDFDDEDDSSSNDKSSSQQNEIASRDPNGIPDTRFTISGKVDTNDENDSHHSTLDLKLENSEASSGQSKSKTVKHHESDKNMGNEEFLQYRLLFDESFLSAAKSIEKTPEDRALLLAMSIALTDIDSEWMLGTAQPSKKYGELPELFDQTLGARDRRMPWKARVGENCELSNRPNLERSMSRKWKSSVRALQAMKITRTGSLQSVASRGIDLSSFLSARQKSIYWSRSLLKLDPRWQIRKFFNDMSVFGSVLSSVNNSDHKSDGAAIFSVWRPTSPDAIAKMMKGDGTGKGLEIKGKSAKKGALSGYIPFLQIHEDEHKNQIRTIPKSDRTRIFFKTRRARDMVGKYLGNIAKEMTVIVAKAKFALAKAKCECDPETILCEELNYANEVMSFELENPTIDCVDEYAPAIFCIEAPVRVVWEGLVVQKDISRIKNSQYDTGRASQPAFQDMNLAALRRRKPNEPLPVLYQCSDDDPFDARMLVMAYEEEERIVPVVSDFDCFLIGSRNFSYQDRMPDDQVELLEWCVSQIEWILDNQTDPDSWTTTWLEILKHAARQNFYPQMPCFGFGDPTSYSMIEAAVSRSAKTCGAVRHGPECFNFFFPQELDDKFLIIFPGNEMWKYVNVHELQAILREKIREGFTFPLNPKWVLCDPGWINLFKELLNSNIPSVRKSIDLWFPPESGLKERILEINKRHPDGFMCINGAKASAELAEQEYERYLILQRARKKVRGFVFWKNLLEDTRKSNKTSNLNVGESLRNSIKEFSFLGSAKLRRLSVDTNEIENVTLQALKKQNFFRESEEDHLEKSSSSSSLS